MLNILQLDNIFLWYPGGTIHGCCCECSSIIVNESDDLEGVLVRIHVHISCIAVLVRRRQWHGMSRHVKTRIASKAADLFFLLLLWVD